MKANCKVLILIVFLFAMLGVSAQGPQVKYQVVYNTATSLYEAHAIVSGSELEYPGTIPFPSKFSIVVPSHVGNEPLQVVQSINPPGVIWAQNNSIFSPASAPQNNFYAFTIGGGGGNNAYQDVVNGSDILLFTFMVPGMTGVQGIRCYTNGSDPSSAAKGMEGIDFRQSFKMFRPGKPYGNDLYASNLTSEVKSTVLLADHSDTFQVNTSSVSATEEKDSEDNPVTSTRWDNQE